MSSEPSAVNLADTVSELLYAIAGWLLVGLGVLGVSSSALRLVSGPTSASPVAVAVVFLFGLLSVLFGVFVNPRFRRRLADRGAVTQFGRTRRVDSRVLRAKEGQRESCVSCATSMDEGLVRRYREQFFVAGVPAWTLSEGRNYYCIDCATAELSGTSQTIESTSRSSETADAAMDRR